MTEEKLIEKLKLIQALFDGTTAEGEKTAARSAAQRIQERLKDIQDKPVEYKFTLSDSWSRKLFVALLRRYGLKPFRYHRQRHTTVMVLVSESFVDNVLWPEYKKLSDVLNKYLEETTNKIIAQSVHSDFTEAEVKDVKALGDT